MSLSWQRMDRMVHVWANRLGFDPHNVEWRIARRDDGTFEMTIAVDSEDGRAVVPFRSRLPEPNEHAVQDVLLAFRRRVNPNASDDEHA